MILDRIGGVMFSVLASHDVDRGFEPRSWVQASVVENRRLLYWYFLLFREVRSIKE